MNHGIIQVYTGNGKGKTTAAIGLAVRACGQGLRVIFFQFLKAPLTSGEHFLLTHLSDNLVIRPLGSGELIINRLPTIAEYEMAQDGWQEVKQAIHSLEYDVVIIDELSHAVNLKLLDIDEVVQILNAKPQSVEIVITGSNMPELLLKTAALITEMAPVKHPYTDGVICRKGIEY